MPYKRVRVRGFVCLRFFKWHYPFKRAKKPRTITRLYGFDPLQYSFKRVMAGDFWKSVRAILKDKPTDLFEQGFLGHSL
jgi:hypothetical protein